MAVSHGRKLYFAITATPSGGTATTDLSTYTQEVSGFPGEQDSGDITVGGNVGYSSYPGLQKLTFTTKMVLDDASGGSWATLASFQSLQQASPTTPWGVKYGPRGNTTGSPSMAANCWITGISVPAKVSDPNIMNVNWVMTAGTSGITISTFA